jgi:uncharacterized Fe-S radical SAM superfamily protein PflX
MKIVWGFWAIFSVGSVWAMDSEQEERESLSPVEISQEHEKLLSSLFQQMGSDTETAKALNEFVQSKSLIDRKGRIVRTKLFQEKEGEQRVRLIRLLKDDGMCYRDLKIYVHYIPQRGGRIIIPPGAKPPVSLDFYPVLGEFGCE